MAKPIRFICTFLVLARMIKRRMRTLVRPA
jgi:hypothetical protein